MTNFDYSLDRTNYSWRNAFLWGNFVGHCKKAGEGSLGKGIVHVLIAAIEFLPIISQITSIFEKLIIDKFSSSASSKPQPLTEKQVSIETSKEKHKAIPKPNDLTDVANESLENFKVNNRQSTLAIPKSENVDKKDVSQSVTISPVREVCKGVYTAEGRTEKGENIYFGMELIDDTSREIWRDYSTAAYNLCDGILRRMVRFLDDENKLKDLQPHSGLSEEEFKNLTSQFRTRGLHPQGKLAEAISDIPGGIVGFMIEPNLSGPFAPATYVAYISKKPITGPLSLPKTESNLKIFKEKYKDILMSVGVRLDDSKPLFENRGIFRNPFSVIEGGYSNIATQLHAFTGKVMKERINQILGDKEKLYMSVSPIHNMKELLVKKIGLERIKTKNDIPEELRIISSGLLEEQFLIQLEDLANLH